MKKIAPYSIKNVYLNEKDSYLIPFPKRDKRYYYVFWWSSIPLGHLYKEEFANGDFTKEMIDAIIPTLKSYKANAVIIQYIIAAIKKKDHITFSQLMHGILSPYLELNLPDKVDISVVICTRNRSDSLKKCLDSIIEQICTPSEIIVIDNAPTDDLTYLAVKLYENVTYYKEPRPGLDIARNTGARLAKFPIVAYTDDDVRVDKLWSYRVWEVFLQENIDAMTGLIIASSLETESQQIFEKHWGFNKGYQDILFDGDFIYKSATVPKVWEIGAGANMAFRKKAIADVGYFDERLDVGAAGCSGDSEVWFRLLANHGTIQYSPLAFVYHEHRTDLKQLHKQLFGYMRGHAASVLIQHDLDKKIGYRKYLYFDLAWHYIQLVIRGFPNYTFRYQTLMSEIKGLISGVRFYWRNKNKPNLGNQFVK